MVFSSIPLYHIDPPNWNQPNQQPPSNESPHLLSPPSSMMIANQTSTQNQTSGGGVSRPGSMAERARLAKIPQPEPALKCPRCDSTNTKFCYFNNYSLSQPRHFCKTCRRYWTRGGALRNVPVGGGCRRNKRSSNKSGGGGTTSSAAATAPSSSSCSTATSGSTVIPSNFGLHRQLPFLSSFADQYTAAAAAAANLGLNFCSQQQLDAGDYVNSSVNGLDQWRIQQFPFLGGLDSSPSASHITGIYPNFDGEGFHHMPSKAMSSTTTSGLISQLASVKMEDRQPQAALSLPRQYLGIPGNDQYLGGGWARDLSGFNPSSSSSGNML